ncbi:hypothetical protein QR680_006438 [Steinernema hermaphroditum]|uniref:Uncharacterized protein n=1 Tax=Steinernema hermaphroditum TaxID=289476 RepID=A0AA39LXE3_9BILA|nr:hypothetical protein QR680_006438 [Steinernema hermaphroditum]
MNPAHPEAQPLTQNPHGPERLNSISSSFPGELPNDSRRRQLSGVCIKKGMTTSQWKPCGQLCIAEYGLKICTEFLRLTNRIGKPLRRFRVFRQRGTPPETFTDVINEWIRNVFPFEVEYTEEIWPATFKYY